MKSGGSGVGRVERRARSSSERSEVKVSVELSNSNTSLLLEGCKRPMHTCIASVVVLVHPLRGERCEC